MVSTGKLWYVLRVASNKEEQVCAALERKIKIEGIDDIVGRVLVPTEKVKRIRGKTQRVAERKLYPGYVFVEMALDEDGNVSEKCWFLIKETNGVGDFIGTDNKPTPMKPHDVDKMLAEMAKGQGEGPTVRIEFNKGDQVKIREGPFENYEGTVEEVVPDKGLVRVIVNIFGRATPLELEYWQIEAA